MTVKKMSQFKFEQLICGDNIVTYLGLRLGEKKKKKKSSVGGCYDWGWWCWSKAADMTPFEECKTVQLGD